MWLCSRSQDWALRPPTPPLSALTLSPYAAGTASIVIPILLLLLLLAVVAFAWYKWRIKG